MVEKSIWIIEEAFLNFRWVELKEGFTKIIYSTNGPAYDASFHISVLS